MKTEREARGRGHLQLRRPRRTLKLRPNSYTNFWHDILLASVSVFHLICFPFPLVLIVSPFTPYFQQTKGRPMEIVSGWGKRNSYFFFFERRIRGLLMSMASNQNTTDTLSISSAHYSSKISHCARFLD